MQPYGPNLHGKITFLPTPTLPLGVTIPNGIWIDLEAKKYETRDAKGEVVTTGQAVLTDSDVLKMCEVTLKQEIMRLRGRFNN